MVEGEMPPRIWIDRGPNGGWMFRTKKLRDSVREYVPATALAAKEAENAELRAQSAEWMRQHENLLFIRQQELSLLHERTELLRRALAYLPSTLVIAQDIRGHLANQAHAKDNSDG